MRAPAGFRPYLACKDYCVDKYGNVMSSKRGDWRPMKIQTTRIGYHEARLSIGGKTKHISLHRMVLESWVGPCPDGCECRHLDGDKSNNSLSNLVWGTKLENAADSITNGSQIRGDRVCTTKLSDSDVRKIRSRLKRGESQTVIAKDFGMHMSTIWAIAHGKIWKHVS